MSEHQSWDAIIIGAGAAGLMCAAIAGKRGLRILLLDHAEKAGKKILISGGGRCNFTNHFAGPEHFISTNPHFCKSALARFSSADFLDLVEAHGIAWHEREHGQLFCDNSARDILDMLITQCRAGDVTIQTQTSIDKIDHAQAFNIHTNRGLFSGRQLVIASGGLSIPKMGATPFGLKLAEQFGLRIITPRAGLVPLTFTGEEKSALHELAGISLDVRASCGTYSFKEAMLFTHRGLSGPAILQISSYWQPGESITIDLLPELNIEDELKACQSQRPQAQLSTALSSLISQPLAKRLVRLLCNSVITDMKLEQLRSTDIDKTSNALHHWHLKPAASEGYRTAEVTLGGIDTNELSSTTMGAKRVAGLHFIGEVVDVTGHLGGFNFQWAWSSGHACGSALQPFQQ